MNAVYEWIKSKCSYEKEATGVARIAKVIGYFSGMIGELKVGIAETREEIDDIDIEKAELFAEISDLEVVQGALGSDVHDAMVLLDGLKTLTGGQDAKAN